MIPSHPRTPPAPPPAAGSPRLCRDCAGWWGAGVVLGHCALFGTLVADDSLACPYFQKKPIVRVH